MVSASSASDLRVATDPQFPGSEILVVYVALHLVPGAPLLAEAGQ